MAKKIVRVEFDQDEPNPLKEWDGMWTLHHWNDHFRDHENKWRWFTEEGKVPPWLQSKLRAGLAWWVHYEDYGSHGSRFWVDEDITVEPDEVDGIFVWENPISAMGARTRAERLKDAEANAETFGNWCNGNVYGYAVEDEGEEEIDSCWGFFPENDRGSLDYMVEQINHSIEPTDRVKVVGDAAYAIDKSKLKGVLLGEAQWNAYRDPEPEYSI